VALWREVVEALDEIIPQYERVNHLISLLQDDRSRLIGLHLAGRRLGVGLELGSGPGNFSRMISSFHDGPLVCLDFLASMHIKAKQRNHATPQHHHVIAVFEQLPLKTNAFHATYAAYALRDAVNKTRAVEEASRVLRRGGRLLVVDIGKPDNRFLMESMGLYMRLLVPLVGGLSSGYGPRNPWGRLYDTYLSIPSNKGLLQLLNTCLEVVERVEILLGGIVVILARKPSPG